MSRTVINPKSGRNLFRAPDNGIDCMLIGRICYLMNAPYIKSSDDNNDDDRPYTWADMPYHATKKQCQEMAGALLSVTDAILKEVFEYSRHCFSEDYTLADFRKFCIFYGRYLKKLKHGYIESGDYEFACVQKLIHQLMPRALLWSVTDTEEKFREWLEKPNSSFPGNFSPKDILWQSREPGMSHLVNIIRDHIENRISGIPH